MTQNSTSFECNKKVEHFERQLRQWFFVNLLQIETHFLHVEPFNPSRRTVSFDSL